MAKLDWKERLNIVYSTNPDFQYEKAELEDVETLINDLDQALRRRYWKGAAGNLLYPLVKRSLNTQ